MALAYYAVIPQVGTRQTFAIALGGNTYQLTFQWRSISTTGSNIANAGTFTADTTDITADSSITVDSVDASAQTLPFSLGAGNDSWVVDIADSSGVPIITGIPLVTGVNLLQQYAYLGLGGGLWVQTSSDPDSVPTFNNLGGDAQLYWVVNTSNTAAQAA